MNRRIPFIFLFALASLSAPAIVAAAEPAVTATVVPGHEIDVTGTGFPSDADVLLVIERSGSAAGSQTLHTDAAGSFSTTIDAGPGRGGAYTMIATSGSAKAVANAVAVETAGAGPTGGVQQTPPPTDAGMNPRAGSSPASGWVFGLFVALVGLFVALGYLRHRAVGEV